MKWHQEVMKQLSLATRIYVTKYFILDLPKYVTVQ